MSPKERLFLKNYSIELIGLAAADYVTAEVLQSSAKVRRENTLYHFEL